jgi:hypothetical protein
MTKQEAIKKAYLEVGIPFNEKVLYDSGWLKIKPSQYSRPKSLSGIENNNGWINIESGEDLPKDGQYWTISSNDGQMTTNRIWSKQWNFNHRYISHYQPIIKPEPPIY